MATYVIGDIHNSIKKLDKMIKLLSPTMQDQIIILGDLFDRGGAEPDPVGIYFRICGLNTNLTMELLKRSEEVYNNTGIIHLS